MKTQPRGNRVVFKVNDAELLKLERYAAKKGTTVSGVLRMYIHRLPAIHNDTPELLEPQEFKVNSVL